MFFGERRQGAALSHDGPLGDHGDGLPGVHHLAGCTPGVLSANTNTCRTEKILEKVYCATALQICEYLLSPYLFFILCKCVIFYLYNILNLYVKMYYFCCFYILYVTLFYLLNQINVIPTYFL